MMTKTRLRKMSPLMVKMDKRKRKKMKRRRKRSKIARLGKAKPIT